MRRKRLKLIVLLLFGLGLTGLQAQTLYVKEKNCTQTAYALNSIQKLTFSSGNVVVQKTNNTAGVHALSGVSYMNFTDLMIGHSILTVYPNPVIDVLNIDFTCLIGEYTISILTVEGKLMQTLNTNGNSLIAFNTSNLSPGIYLCRFANETEIKTIKFAKR
jgi:hypothetical protein